MSLEEYLTVNEAAEMLGVSGSRVRQFIRENRLASTKVGNLRLIKKTDAKSFEMGKTGRPEVENPSKNTLAQRKYRGK